MPVRSYPSYRDSGVEWIGQIPEHWNVKPSRTAISERHERSKHGEEQLLSVSEYTGVRPRSENVSDEEMLTRATSLVDYKVAHRGDLVMNIMLAWKSGLGVSDFYGIVSPAYCVFCIGNLLASKYVHYLLRTTLYTSRFEVLSTGIMDSRLRLYPQTFKSVPVLFPPIEEQQAIASFLDRETSKIDTLVTKQEELIGFLKEKRSGLISHAVTKGLNSAAPMKPSGVDWIGQIPEHWELRRLKDIAKVTMGYSFASDQLGEDGVPVVRMSDLREGRICIDGAKRTPPSASLDAFTLRPGDILYGMSGSVGNIGLVDESVVPCYLNQRIACIRKNSNLVEQQILWWTMCSAVFSEQILHFGTGTAQVNVSPTDLRNASVALPPLEEQQAIAAYLDRETAKIDKLIDRATATIAFLKERRASLITAAVTGQIDVRGAA